MAFEGWFCTAAITSPTAPPASAIRCTQTHTDARSTLGYTQTDRDTGHSWVKHTSFRLTTPHPTVNHHIHPPHRLACVTASLAGMTATEQICQ
eukprot:541817-Rhodomonas_salina.1